MLYCSQEKETGALPFLGEGNWCTTVLRIRKHVLYYFQEKGTGALLFSGKGLWGFTVLIFFVKLDFVIAVDQQTRAHDQTFEGVPDPGCPPVPAGQPRPYLVNFCQITLTCSQPCFGVLYLYLLIS